MSLKHKLLWTMTGLTLILLLALSVFAPDRVDAVPDFSAYTRVEEKKDAFFNYLLPHISEANQEIWEDRQWLLRLAERQQQGESLSGHEERQLRSLAHYYELESPEEFSTPRLVRVLLRRVDIIPPSLALAQAANESGWGTSRFAREGRNFFGMWCYEPGCGMVPLERPADAIYEVKSYRKTADSVRDYMHNLNTHSAYQSLRELRAQARMQEEIPKGGKLAGGLYRYSERGDAYIDSIRGLISYNKLETYDEAPHFADSLASR